MAITCSAPTKSFALISPTAYRTLARHDSSSASPPSVTRPPSTMRSPEVLSWLQRRLSRVTSLGDYVPEIDGLRFVAIAWVVAFHLCVFIETRTDNVTSNYVTWLFKQGRLGVPCFSLSADSFSAFLLRSITYVARPPLACDAIFCAVTRLEPRYGPTVPSNRHPQHGLRLWHGAAPSAARSRRYCQACAGKRDSIHITSSTAA